MIISYGDYDDLPHCICKNVAKSEQNSTILLSNSNMVLNRWHLFMMLVSNNDDDGNDENAV